METKFPLGGDSQNSDKVVFKNHKNKYYLTAEPVMGTHRVKQLQFAIQQLDDIFNPVELQ